MADGSLIIRLDEATEARLKAAAEALGESTRDFVLRVVANVLDDDWAEDMRIAEACDRDGQSISAEDAFANLDAKMAARRVGKD